MNRKLLTIIYCFSIMFIIYSHIDNAEASTERNRDIAKISIEDSFLTAFDNSGHPAWIKKFESIIEFYEFADLDSDGRNESIIITKNSRGKNSILYVINSNGEQLWQFDFLKIKNIYNGSSNRFLVCDLLVESLWNNDTKNILVHLRNYPYYATNFILFDFKGHVLGSYWHPGNIFDVEVMDVDYDGHFEIVGGGVNNDWATYNYRPIIFVLDPAKMNGQAPPWLGNFPRAKEKYYKILPQSKILTRSCAVKEIWQEDNSTIALLDDDSFFYFDSNMSFAYAAKGLSLSETEKEIRDNVFWQIFYVFIGALMGLVLPLISAYLIKHIKWGLK